ncbi:hypothetical protein KFE25_001100 [Diacronema lutheri]|uniref:3'(2'),5'-bisphosphate nucleotidase n=1 Tax=Diacronema lutheri TaxID=2081491 RepID=A0A8J6C815_DIALT|nr:hypothetical protein KFE25_001100 [Diacronema lutheri]
MLCAMPRVALLVGALVAGGARGARVLARPASAMTPRASARMAATNAPAGSLQALCEVSKSACDAVEPMLKKFYDKISTNGRTAEACEKKKADATFFTIADGILQHMFVSHLFAGNKFAHIVGEEDSSVINIATKPYFVDELEVPEEFEQIIDETLARVRALAATISDSAYRDITAFVDPIDGTREFALGQGDKVTVLLGFNDRDGRPCAGIMYRPLTAPVTWAAGALSEGYKAGVLDHAATPNPTGCLITDGKVSPFIAKTIEELGYNLVPSLASGNRAMMLLEGKAGYYIRDTGGFALWDTSGPQACIEAYGGTMAKLPAFLEDGALVTYTHLKSEKNLDFVPGAVMLSLTNAKVKSEYDRTKDTPARLEQVNAYVCCAGLVAASPDNTAEGTMAKLRSAMLKVAADGNPPYYT